MATKANGLNGVNIDTFSKTIEAIKVEPEIAKFRFKVHNRWVDGGLNQTEVKDFYGAKQTIRHEKKFELACDEPPVLIGNDQGPNPVEHLLNALAGCMTTTMVYHAALRGIQIEELESELEGDIDLRGFLGLTDEVRRGYENIRVKFKVKTAAENLDRLRALSKLSPVFDVTSKGTKIDVQFERK